MVSLNWILYSPTAESRARHRHLMPKLNCSAGHESDKYWNIFYRQDALIEVDALIRLVWHLDRYPDIEAVQLKGGANHLLKIWESQGISRVCETDVVCNTSAITRILSTLIRDQLGLRRYGRLLGGIGIKRAGSGGAVNWTKIPAHKEDHTQSYPYTREYRYYQSIFVAADGGRRLDFIPATKPSLSILPEDLRARIFRHAITPDRPVIIDVGKQSGFELGLQHVNKEMYMWWRQAYMQKNRFSLSMTTTEPTSTFDGFISLARVLRTPLQDTCRLFLSPGYYQPSNFLLEDDSHCRQKVFVTLEFDIPLPIAVERLRISILPLIMETSGTLGHDEAHITIKYPKAHYGHIIQAEYRINLGTLRYNVARAVRDFVWNSSESTGLRRPEVWINGLGNVVKVVPVDGPPPSKIPIEYDNTHRKTVKDMRYKSNVCQGCPPSMFTSVFPFGDLAQATLDYLCYVIRCKDNGQENWCLM